MRCRGVSLLVAGVLAAAQSAGQAAYEKAHALFTAQKLPEAVAAVNDALRLDPDYVPALTLKAKLALAAYDYGVARQCLERALAIAPQSGYAHFLYGLEAYLSNNLKEALPRLREARRLNPADARVALYLGLTLESLGQTDEALRLYEEAARRDETADTLLPGARLLLLLGRLDESERRVRRAMQLAPHSRDAEFTLARLLLQRGEAAQAAAAGERALRLTEGTTTDAAIRFLLVRAWRAAGQPERAASHAEIMRAQEQK